MIRARRTVHLAAAAGGLVLAVTAGGAGAAAAPAPAARPAAAAATTTATTAIPPDAAHFFLRLTDSSTTGLPSTISPGFHAFTIRQSAKEPRGMQVARLKPGYSLKDMQRDVKAQSQQNAAAFTAYKRLVSHVVALAGLALAPGYVATGNTFVVNLAPGQYVFENAAVEQGPTVDTLVTVPASTPVGVKPVTAGTFGLHDFGFRVPRIKAGRGTYALYNSGDQPHFIQLARIGNHTKQDVQAAVNDPNASGPPPWAHDTGYAGIISPGATMFTSMYFSPGRYAAVCFLPDIEKAPGPMGPTFHAMEGMISVFDVS